MGLSSTTNRVSFVGDASSTIFSFPYYFFNQSDLKVYLFDTIAGGITPQTLSTNYTISGSVTAQGVYPGGGSVIMNSAFPSNLELIITRSPSPIQNFSLNQNSPINSLALVQQLDYLTALAQRLEDQVSLAVAVPDGVGPISSIAFNPALPSNIGIINSSANTALIVNSSATAFIIGPTANMIMTANSSAIAAAASAVTAIAQAAAAAISAISAAAYAGSSAASAAMFTSTFPISLANSSLVTGLLGPVNIGPLGSTYVRTDGLSVMTGSFNMGTNQITNVVDPTTAQMAATKNYVDNIASQLNPIQAAYAASIGANVVGTYLNGALGIGATYTVTALGSFIIDGQTPPVNARILLKDQSSGFQNGVYNLTVTGSAAISTNPILTRALDYDTAADMNAGDLIPIINGTVNVKTTWLQTATIGTVGTDPLVFTQWTSNLPAIAPVGAGGTGTGTSYIQFGLIYASSATQFSSLPVGTAGQAMISGGAGVPPAYGPIVPTNSVVSKTATYQATTSDSVIEAASGCSQITLFGPVGNSGRTLTFKKTVNSFDQVVINCSAAVFDGSSISTTLATWNESVQFYCNGVGWQTEFRRAPLDWIMLGSSILTMTTGAKGSSSTGGMIDNVRMTREGREAVYDFQYNHTTAGTGATDAIRLTLPNILIDTNFTGISQSTAIIAQFCPAGLPNCQVLMGLNVSTLAGGDGTAFVYSSTQVRLWVNTAGASAGLWGTAQTNLSNSAVNILARIRVPVIGWQPSQ